MSRGVRSSHSPFDKLTVKQRKQRRQERVGEAGQTGCMYRGRRQWGGQAKLQEREAIGNGVTCSGRQESEIKTGEEALG